jgi:magnesium transporter
MIAIYSWDDQAKTGRWFDLGALQTQPEALRARPGTLWIDMEAADDAEEQLVFRNFFSIHPLTLEDITSQRRQPEGLPHFPKVEEFSDYLFVVNNPLSTRFAAKFQCPGDLADESDGLVTQMSTILTPRLLITHHMHPLAGIEYLRTILFKHQSQAERGPDYLFHLILHASVDQYVLVLDRIDDSLEDIEAEVFQRPAPDILRSLLVLKRRITSLRKTLVYEREVLARLARGEFALIEAREMAYYRNVYDHVVQFGELLESSREMASDLMQTHLAAMSNRLNAIMKVLAMISTIVLPMTLIAGIYGMNFEHMPELHWEYGYAYALGLMILAGLCSVLWFRWNQWL